MLNRLIDSRQKKLWDRWLDPADYPVDIRRCVLERLAFVEEVLFKAREVGFTIRPGTEAAILRKSPLPRLMDRVRGANSRKAALDWMLKWFFDNQRPNLFSATPQTIPEQSFFDLLLKLIGFPANTPVLRGKVTDRGAPYWIARLQRIVRLARDREIAQARRDWRVIVRIMNAAEAVDWSRAVPPSLISPKPEPPSWVARKAKRCRPLPPPPIVEVFFLCWRNLDARTGAFCVLLIMRRLFPRSPMPALMDQWMSDVEQWFLGLPRKAGAPQSVA